MKSHWKNAAKLYGFPILTLTLCLLLSGPTALACDCVRGTGILENAKVVFSGKAIRIKYLDRRERMVPEPRIIVTFQVYRVWKGRPGKTMVLHTVFNRWTCNGYWFKEGEEYLVFAGKNDRDQAKMFGTAKNTLGVTTCNGTSSLAAAEKDLKELGDGVVPR